MNVPNALSILRLLMIPAFVLTLFSGSPNAYYIAAGIFLAAALTDILDGYIARRFDQITKLGRFLDPLADKLMKATAIVCLCVIGVIPVWIVVMLFVKELLMLCGGLLVYRRAGDFPASNVFGKAAEFFFCALILAHILFEIPETLSLILWCVSILAEYLAMVIYAVRTWKKLAKEESHEN